MTKLRAAASYAVVALVALLPFLRGILAGRCFYFRDLSRHFFPLRRFAAEGLRRGEVRYWNPFVHEGVPLPLLPLSYPIDALHVFLSDERGFTLLLALHVPLGAVAFMMLARHLGLSRTGSAGGALIYALGGFYLSTLNMYVYLQAAAWAPLVVLAVGKAASGDRRFIAVSAILVAVALSTTGLEIVVQTLVVGLVLAFPPFDIGRLARTATGVFLGLGLAAPSAWVLKSLIADSARGSRFPVEVVVAHSLHPLTLVQLVIGNWHGDLADLVNRWWGSRFFPLGFPYFLSLYLGAAALSVATVGVFHGQSHRKKLLLLALLALVVSLGRWAGLSAIAEAIPVLRVVRFPSKAFFTFHFSVAILAALGIERLRNEYAAAWRTLAVLGVGLGGLLIVAPALPSMAPAATRAFLTGFFPTLYSWPRRIELVQSILSDAVIGGWLVAIVALLALLVLQQLLPAPRAAIGVVAILVTDLFRTGAGLNPMVTPDFYRLSPEMSGVASTVGSSGGRVFSCDAESDPVYFRARSLRVQHDAWTFAVFMETFSPDFNVSFSVPTALSRDLTMLVPESRVLDPSDSGPTGFARIVDLARKAGVSTVICTSPISHPALTPIAVVAPERIAPLMLHAYRLAGALPLRAVAREVHPVGGRAEAEALARPPDFSRRGAVAVEGTLAAARDVSGRVVELTERSDRVDLRVEADQPTVVIVRDAYAAGWTATVNDAPAPLLRADGRHRAVPILAGTSRVSLRYRPPGLAPGLCVAAAALLIVIWFWRRR